MALNSGQARLFSDFGYGFGNSNQGSISQEIMQSAGSGVPILLSHWDLDHYKLAISPQAVILDGQPSDPKCKTWIAPENIGDGPTVNSLVGAIRGNGKLIMWPKTEVSIQAGNIEIRQTMSPDEKNKNNSGALTLLIGSLAASEYLLYPADASFQYIPGIGALSSQLTKLVATHHGSLRSLDDKPSRGASIPAARNQNGMLIYSYGKNNQYRHSESLVRSFYADKGWQQVQKTEDLVSPNYYFAHRFGAVSQLREAKKNKRMLSAKVVGSGDEKPLSRRASGGQLKQKTRSMKPKRL